MTEAWWLAAVVRIHRGDATIVGNRQPVAHGPERAEGPGSEGHWCGALMT
ncbi:hypothetical protein [Streptomyces griseoluteus]